MFIKSFNLHLTKQTHLLAKDEILLTSTITLVLLLYFSIILKNHNDFTNVVSENFKIINITYIWIYGVAKALNIKKYFNIITMRTYLIL